MSENREIQCEYSTTRSNENKCKALEIEFHNCLNILEQKKCPIYKLKQQLQIVEQKLEIAQQGLSLILTVQKECTKCPHQKLDVDILVCDLDCATAFKKIAKQTLEKIEGKENE